MEIVKWFLFADGAFVDLGAENVAYVKSQLGLENPAVFPALPDLQGWLDDRGFLIHLPQAGLDLYRTVDAGRWLLMFDVINVIFMVETRSAFDVAEVLRKIAPLLAYASEQQPGSQPDAYLSSDLAHVFDFGNAARAEHR